MDKKYDIVITGGGAGGLSFLSRLMSDPVLSKKQILLIDREVKNVNDRTWCYWSEDPLPYPKSHVKDWSRCEIGKGGIYVYKATGAYKYREINSLLFYQEVHERIDKATNIARLIADVAGIVPRLDKCLVETEDLTIEADVVINSVPGLMQALPSSYYLTQNFKGVRIKTEKPVFDPKMASLMDFHETKDPCGSSFFYVLPYSETEALIEYTRFSSEVADSASYDPYIDSYLQEKYAVWEYEILETEIGVIPMTDFSYESNPHPRVFQIGTIAGDTKPTTGYTFHFIQQRAKDIVEILNEKQSSVSVKSTSFRFRFYDRLLLSIMVREPKRVKDIMFTLFSKVPLPRILKFLDQKTSLWEEALIFLTLPKLLFISAIFIAKPKLYASPRQTSVDTAVRRAL